MDDIKLLIVDDIEENLLSLELLLENEDMEIIRARSGQEALERTLDHDFFLILMDVQMPGMNGYETAELLRGNSRTRNIPIIFLTANNREEEQLFKGYDAGAVDYLVKPVAPRILKSKINIFKAFHLQHLELIRKTEELNNNIAELEELQGELEKKNQQLKILSIEDGLTGLYNRRYFNEALESEWDRSIRTGKPLSLIMGDIDKFKAYNDSYGHPKGDECLKKVASLFMDIFRRSIDKVARYGGEEFIALMPDTDSAGAQNMAETLIETVRKEKIPHDKSVHGNILTISLGVCSVVPDEGKSHADFLNCVDQALYSAKAEGRNCWKNRAYSD